MALFRFRTRNPERDRDTDESRRQRLEQLLDALSAEIERERGGLRNRYDKVTADAAFSQQALEDDRADGEISSRIDDLTGAMLRYTKRLVTLEQQSVFVTEIRSRINTFFRENARPEHSPEPVAAQPD